MRGLRAVHVKQQDVNMGAIPNEPEDIKAASASNPRDRSKSGAAKPSNASQPFAVSARAHRDSEYRRNVQKDK